MQYLIASLPSVSYLLDALTFIKTKCSANIADTRFHGRWNNMERQLKFNIRTTQTAGSSCITAPPTDLYCGENPDCQYFLDDEHNRETGLNYCKLFNTPLKTNNQGVVFRHHQCFIGEGF